MTRSRRTMIAFIAVLAIAVLAPAVPAGAISIAPAPPPSGDTYEGGSGGSGSGGGSFRCDGGRGVDTIGRSWYDSYPGCWGFRHTGRFAWCPTGFEVYRFWGTVEEPVLGHSVSKVNLNADTCTGGKQMLATSEHPEDTRTGLWPGMTVWRTSQSAEINNSWLNASKTRFRNVDHYTTNQPFRFTGRNCREVQAKNTRLRSYQFGGANYNSAIAPAIRSWIQAEYNKATPNNQMGLAWANAAFDREKRSDSHFVTGDGFDCSSVFDYQAQLPDGANYETHPKSRLTGLCYVPTMRWSERFEASNMTWYSGRRLIFTNGEFNGGRDVYVGYTAADANPTLRTSQLRTARNHYRDHILFEIMTRPNTLQYANSDGLPPGAWNNGVGGYNRGYAATYASQSAFCTSGYAGAWTATEVPGSSGEELKGTGVELLVNTPEAGQVGGMLRAPAKVSATTGRVLCGTAPCTVTAAGPRVQRVDTDGRLRLQAPPVADWRVRPGSPNAARYTGGNFNLRPTGATDWSLDFFRPTEGDQLYNVTASGHAIIEGDVKAESGMTICWSLLFRGKTGGCEQIGGDGGIASQTKRVPLVPVFNGGTDRAGVTSFPVIGATATPIEGHR